MGKTYEDGVGNGQAVCAAVEENSKMKEARRECREGLHITMM